MKGSCGFSVKFDRWQSCLSSIGNGSVGGEGALYYCETFYTFRFIYMNLFLLYK